MVQALSGVQLPHVEDPYLTEVTNWGYQELQQHQKRLVDRVAALHDLAATSEGGGRAAELAALAKEVRGLLASHACSSAEIEAVLAAAVAVGEEK